MLEHPRGRHVSSAADYERILRNVEALRNMTRERGCTVGEADEAARKLGQLIQRHGLEVRAPRAIHESANRAVSIHDVEALAQTDKALLVLIDGDEVWVPYSQIARESEVRAAGDSGVLVVSSWWFGKQGWRHAW